MRLRGLVLICGLLLVGTGLAMADGDIQGVSGCVVDHPNGVNFTCHVYEYDPNGNPIESQTLQLPSEIGTGYLVYTESAGNNDPSNWSDVVQFFNSNGNGFLTFSSDPLDPALIAAVQAAGAAYFVESASGVNAFFSGGAIGVNNDYYFYSDPPEAAVPEPASLMLMGSGLIGLAGRLRKRFS